MSFLTIFTHIPVLIAQNCYRAWGCLYEAPKENKVLKTEKNDNKKRKILDETTTNVKRQKVSTKRPETLKTVPKVQTYVDYYDENLQELCKTAYLAIQSRSNFQLPQLETLSDDGKDLLSAYGQMSSRMTKWSTRGNQGKIVLVFNQKFGEKNGFDKMELPIFTYVTSNSGNFVKGLLGKPVVVEKSGNGKNGKKPVRVKNMCPGKCLCDKMFAEFYDNSVQNLSYLVSGRINFHKFNRMEPRMILECTDQCGCDETCPRRVLQRGSQVPLALVIEDEHIGFDVRSIENIKEGQLICEVNGDLLFPDDEKLNPSWAFGMASGESSLHLLRKGNIARFVNHSCNPNAVVVEISSRKNVKTEWKPKMGLFALKAITAGSSITFDYLETRDPIEEHENAVQCRCGSGNKCRGMVVL